MTEENQDLPSFLEQWVQPEEAEAVVEEVVEEATEEETEDETEVIEEEKPRKRTQAERERERANEERNRRQELEKQMAVQQSQIDNLMKALTMTMPQQEAAKHEYVFEDDARQLKSEFSAEVEPLKNNTLLANFKADLAVSVLETPEYGEAAATLIEVAMNDILMQESFAAGRRLSVDEVPNIRGKAKDIVRNAQFKAYMENKDPVAWTVTTAGIAAPKKSVQTQQKSGIDIDAMDRARKSAGISEIKKAPAKAIGFDFSDIFADVANRKERSVW